MSGGMKGCRAGRGCGEEVWGGRYGGEVWPYLKAKGVQLWWVVVVCGVRGGVTPA